MRKRTICYGLGINFLVAGSVSSVTSLAIMGVLFLASVKLIDYVQGETVTALVVSFFTNMAITLLPTALTADEWKVAAYLAMTLASTYIAGFVYFIAKYRQK